MATGVSRPGWVASTTRPMPPLPRTLVTLYLPSMTAFSSKVSTLCLGVRGAQALATVGLGGQEGTRPHDTVFRDPGPRPWKVAHVAALANLCATLEQHRKGWTSTWPKPRYLAHSNRTSWASVDKLGAAETGTDRPADVLGRRHVAHRGGHVVVPRTALHLHDGERHPDDAGFRTGYGGLAQRNPKVTSRSVGVARERLAGISTDGVEKKLPPRFTRTPLRATSVTYAQSTQGA